MLSVQMALQGGEAPFRELSLPRYVSLISLVQRLSSLEMTSLSRLAIKAVLRCFEALIPRPRLVFYLVTGILVDEIWVRHDESAHRKPSQTIVKKYARRNYVNRWLQYVADKYMFVANNSLMHYPKDDRLENSTYQAAERLVYREVLLLPTVETIVSSHQIVQQVQC
ncbi:hypothetical protein COLO4_35599 [Corchorus olitorius]|uniref:Uncharacterized protein n=1 Tax=Corchorus olitorius TaxID=93759 RepID=A0A1R3GET6_9ROSI|nr:hypothetical protein COLO4_35599 [Corchorus olitorius]